MISQPRIRIGAALFNADHTRLGEELRRTEAAGIDFLHLDVFDGYAVRDQAFPARTIHALRQLTKLPFEVHLSAAQPERFLKPLADAGAELVFLPAEHTPLLYETVYSLRELGMRAGLCLALGTPLQLLEATLPLIDAVLLLGRVTGEGHRGRDFNQLVIGRVRQVRALIDCGHHAVDLQAAGGMEIASCIEAVRAGATSLPLGAALYREADMSAYVAALRGQLDPTSGGAAAPPAAGRSPLLGSQPTTSGLPHSPGARILIASRSFGRNCPEVLDEIRGAGCAFLPHAFQGTPSEAELLACLADADIVVSGTELLNARVLEAAPKLRLIAKHGIGYENIDLTAARQRNIQIALAGPVMADSVADLAIGLLLALARQIPTANALVKAGRWDRLVGTELRGKTLGIVGLGQIGRAVARRAKAFGMDLIACDAIKDAAFAASWSLRYLDLDELLARADAVTLHAPLTPQTRLLMGARQFACMRRSAFLINTSRGELVDEQALHAALVQGQIAGAATDVFSKEPPGPSPLLELDQFIATPHLGGQTTDALRRMGRNTAENILRYLRGEPPLFQPPAP